MKILYKQKIEKYWPPELTYSPPKSNFTRSNFLKSNQPLVYIPSQNDKPLPLFDQSQKNNSLTS